MNRQRDKSVAWTPGHLTPDEQPTEPSRPRPDYAQPSHASEEPSTRRSAPHAPGQQPRPTIPADPTPASMPESMAASMADSMASAARPIPFRRLVRVEFGKLGDTLSGRVLLITGPLLLVFLNLVVILGTPQGGSLANQIGVTVVLIQFGQMGIHAAVIKSVAGEWLYRGVQPTLLLQPSRSRYFLAQTAVAGLLWLGCSILQLACTLILTPIAAANNEMPYLLGDRLGWVCAVCLFGSLLVMSVAVTASMLLLNPAGALAMYFVAVPMMAILASVVPALSWVNPFTAASELATMSDYLVPYPGIVSLLLWTALLSAARRRVVTHDVA